MRRKEKIQNQKLRDAKKQRLKRNGKNKMLTKVQIPDKSFYNLREAAAALEMSAGTLRKYVKAGRVPCVLNDGRYYRFSRAEIERIKNGEIKLDATQN